MDEALEQLRAAAAAQQEVAAAIRAAEAEVAQAQAHVQKAEDDRNAAQARLRVAQADLQRSRTLLAYAEIKAPFAGVVTERGVDHGHFVQPGGGGAPLLVVAQLDRVRVCVDVPEGEAALVDAGAESGDPAVVRVQSLGAESFSGAVARTSWALDGANRSLRAEVDLPNPQGALRPGMYATVQILLVERPDAQTLPKTALVHEGEQTFCCCVEGGVIRRQPLRVGLRTPSEVEFLEGLSENSLVVQTRADSLQEAQPVEILPATP